MAIIKREGEFCLRKLVLFVLLVSLLPLFACSPGNSDEKEALHDDSFPAEHQSHAEIFASIYPVTDNNPFIMASYEQVIRHLEQGTGLLVFGFPDCPRCHNAFPVLEKAFNQMDMGRHAGFRGKILYYYIYEDRQENNEHYLTIVEYLKDFLNMDDSGNPRIFVPDVYFLVLGDIVGNHKDTVSSVVNPSDPLNYEQESELLEIYMGLIGILGDCGC
jgi:hypothetical protein